MIQCIHVSRTEYMMYGAYICLSFIWQNKRIQTFKTYQTKRHLQTNRKLLQTTGNNSRILIIHSILDCQQFPNTFSCICFVFFYLSLRALWHFGILTSIMDGLIIQNHFFCLNFHQLFRISYAIKACHFNSTV